MKKLSQKFVLLRHPKVIMVLVAIVMVVAESASVVHADPASIQQQIDNLNAQNAQNAQSVSSLQLQATSYQNAITKLQAQISVIQNEIAASEAKQAELQQQINADQNQINQEKVVLGDDLKAMYVSGSMTTLEMLATSKNLSSFVDEETYDSAVQNKIQSTLNQIAQLENQQEQQKEQVDELLKSQQSQQTQLANDQAQQNQLLAMNQSQQASYNNQIKSNEAQIQQLQAQLVAQLQALGGTTYYGGTGSYPWANAPCLDGPDAGSTCGDYDWGYPSGPVPLGAPVGPFDPWGYEYRNCTSYVAWKIDSISTSPNIGTEISGLGNAAQWPSNVPESWIDSAPRAHDAAVVPNVAEGQGHVMFVEAVNSDGTIDVSQYNVEPGAYSEQFNMNPSGLIFIHFPGT